jgi:hypothetical protein
MRFQQNQGLQALEIASKIYFSCTPEIGCWINTIARYLYDIETSTREREPTTYINTTPVSIAFSRKN